MTSTGDLNRSAAALGIGAFVVLQALPPTADWALAVLAAACMLAVLHGQLEFDARPDRLELGVALLLGAWLLTAMLGLDARRSLALSIPTLAFALAFVAAYRSRAPSIDRRVVVGALLVAAVLQALVLGVAATTLGLRGTALVRAAGVPWLVVPNDMVWMTVLWPCFAWYASRGSRTTRALVAIALALQLALALVIESRLALVCGALALAVGFGRSWRRLALLVVLFGTVAIALDLLLDTGLSMKGLRSLEARLELWGAALAVFVAHPLTGVGPHNFVIAYVEHLPVAALDPRLTPWPHNLWLELLAETGLAGAAAAGLVLASAARRAQGAASDAWTYAMRGTGFALLVASLFEASSLRIWVWVLAALMLGWRSRVEPAS